MASVQWICCSHPSWQLNLFSLQNKWTYLKPSIQWKCLLLFRGNHAIFPFDITPKMLYMSRTTKWIATFEAQRSTDMFDVRFVTIEPYFLRHSKFNIWEFKVKTMAKIHLIIIKYNLYIRASNSAKNEDMNKSIAFYNCDPELWPVTMKGLSGHGIITVNVYTRFETICLGRFELYFSSSYCNVRWVASNRRIWQSSKKYSSHVGFAFNLAFTGCGLSCCQIHCKIKALGDFSHDYVISSSASYQITPVAWHQQIGLYGQIGLRGDVQW